MELLIRQNQFNAPQYLRDKIESRIIKLFSNLKSKTFKSIELYYDITEKLCLKIKNIAQQNHCYCELKIKTKIQILFNSTSQWRYIYNFEIYY